MHRVYKAEFSLLGPKCPDGAAEPRQNTNNPQLPLQDHALVLLHRRRRAALEEAQATLQSSWEVHDGGERARDGVYLKFIDSLRADGSDMNQLLVAAWDGLRSRTAIGHWAKRGNEGCSALIPLHTGCSKHGEAARDFFCGRRRQWA